MDRKKIYHFILLGAGLIIMNTGCYYDKEEILYPDSACDTANVTYSGSVAPIISSSCNSCHAGNTPSGGIKLSDHASLKIQAVNGKLSGAVNHQAGFSPMPKNSPKLNACNIAILQKWIDAGSPNN